MKLQNNFSATDLKNLDQDSGAECVFVRLSDKLGLKLYSTRRQRDYAYRTQKLAAKYGIGPDVKCLAKSEGLVHPHSGTLCKWGYITELVEIRQLSYQEFDQLVALMEEIGLSTIDLATCANVGIKNGKPVCIDFGVDSMGDDLDYLS